MLHTRLGAPSVLSGREPAAASRACGPLPLRAAPLHTRRAVSTTKTAAQDNNGADGTTATTAESAPSPRPASSSYTFSSSTHGRVKTIEMEEDAGKSWCMGEQLMNSLSVSEHSRAGLFMRLPFLCSQAMAVFAAVCPLHTARIKQHVANTTSALLASRVCVYRVVWRATLQISCP